MKEYVKGMENELYCVDFSPAFTRQFFNVTAHQAFVMFGVIILGVETRKSLSKVKESFTNDGAKVPTEQELRVLAEQRAASVGLVCIVRCPFPCCICFHDIFSLIFRYSAAN